MKGRLLVAAVAGLAALGVLGYAALSATYLLYNRAGDDHLPFSTDFEHGLDDWSWLGARQLCCAHSAVPVEAPVRAGGRALLVTLDREDPSVRGSKRAELRMKSAEYGKTYRYAFSTFLPADWVEDDVPVTLAQWHNVKDMHFAEGGMSPPLRLVVRGGEISVVVRWDEHPISRGPLRRSMSDEEEVLWTGSVEPGRWNDWTFDVRWSYGPDGMVRVAKDGGAILDRKGPNTYNDVVPPYLKLGVYVPAWSRGDLDFAVTRRSVVFDAVHVEEIDPAAPQAVSRLAERAR